MESTTNLQSVVVIVIAYLLGSIPFGYLIVRATQGSDVRETGSGGTGATNVSRRAGKGAGLLTLVLDAAKGASAVALASWLLNTDQVNATVAAAGIAAIVGHCFPVWLGFRGGKGVATGVGVFLLLAPWAVAGAGVIFVLIVWLTRYVSLGSIVAAAAIPALVAVQHFFIRPMQGFHYVLLAAVIGGVLIIIMHRANISRLLDGTENKFK